MGQHGRKPLTIDPHVQIIGLIHKLRNGLPRPAALDCIRDGRRDPHALPRASGFSALQLLQQLVHPGDRVVDRGHGVLEECRVALVLGGVLDHQRLLGDEVLQVVHDERRQSVEGLELAALGQLLIRLVLGQEGGNLATGSPQEIDLLEGQPKR